MIKQLTATALAVLVLGVSGCGEKKEEKSSVAGMKCGAGKCGANMFDGNAALARKKKNMLSQMREEDKRKDCVIKSKTTKALYDCVRDPLSGKLSLKGGSTKCGAGKCGSDMK